MKRKLIILALCLMLVFSIALAVSAENSGVAEDLRKSTTISGSGYDSYKFLLDGNVDTYKKSDGNVTVKLQNEAGIGSLYLMFNLEYGEYTVTDNETGDMITAGQYGYLHEFINLESAFGYCPASVTLHFKKGTVRLSEIRVFSSGKVPSDVQQWQPPLDGKTDLLLLSTHGDDEQLFFAGLLPLYTKELGYNVQVVYMTDHRNGTFARAHEMLNGLWATGVTAYPVMGSFDDFLLESLSATYKEFARLGHSKEELQEFVITQLRRFKPQVVVGHDIAGEYKHGMHMVYTDCLINVLPLSNDPTAFPEVAEKYGVWEVPKTYLHLYDKNKVVIDYDTPLDSWGGLTAFQVTQKYGFECHESQHWTWFTRWLYGSNKEITKASQIKTYNPCQFGLYHSTVGEDVLKNDFMENIVSYAEQERIEQERLEAERQEQERLEQERLEAERQEQERLEQEQKEQAIQQDEQQDRIEKEQLEQALQQRAQIKNILLYVCLGILVVLVIFLVVLLSKLSQQKRRRKRKKVHR